MPVLSAFKSVRYIFVLMIMAVIWLMLTMVLFDRLIPPCDRLIPWIMPWKGLNAIPMEANIGERLSIMQGILDASAVVSNYAFFITIISFTAFSVYLTVNYQQKQKRARENQLLLLKNQEIARRNEFIRYISATIGHEFKNNLGRIKRRIDLLPELTTDEKARIDDNLDKLFADIEIFKKISDEREAALIDFENINLREMLGVLAWEYSDLATIAFQDNKLSPTIFASKTLLRTVFENLIDNAIKYKKPEQTRARISITCSLDADGKRQYISLFFRDEGIGMDEQRADQCFYRKRSTQEGWGEGLYFAKYVVGLHAGKIRVGKEYTALGNGTEIIINLPFIEESLDV